MRTKPKLVAAGAYIHTKRLQVAQGSGSYYHHSSAAAVAAADVLER